MLGLKQKLNVVNPAYFDLLTASHGNYSSVNSLQRAIEYATKSGKYTAEGIDVNQFLCNVRNKKSGMMALVCAMVKDGCTDAEIDEKYPHLVLLHRTKIHDYRKFVDSLKDTPLPPFIPYDLTDYPPPLPSDGADDVAEKLMLNDIANWVNTSIIFPRKFKSKQLYLYGGHDMGKTSFAYYLAKYFHLYCAPMQDSYFDDYRDEYHKLVLFDEFSGQYTLQFMNQFLQGGSMHLKKRYQPCVKEFNPMVIITSNLHPCDVFKHASAAYDAFLSRLLIIEVKTPLFPLMRGE